MEQGVDENQVEKFAASIDADELSNDNLIATTSVSAPISESETLEELSEPPVAAPTGINKVLVEKYGYEWVDGAAYKPGTAPQPVTPAPVDSITEPGLDGIDDPFAPVPPVDGAFDPAPIDPFPPTGSIDDPFGPAPIDPIPPVDVPAPPVAAPTGINKILVEKYGYEWVDGAAYKPGTAPQPVSPAPVDPTTEPGLDGIDDPFAPVPPVDGAFDPAPIDPFPPTGSVDDPFGPAPIDPIPPVDVPAPPVAAPTGINKILVEKYGYEWVDGAAYKPGTAPQPVSPAPVDPTTEPGLDGIDDPFAPVPPVDGAFDPAPIDPFPPTGSVDDPFGPAPIGPFPPVDVPEPPVFDSRFDDVNDAIEYAEANGQGDLAVSEDGTITNSNGETMVYDSDGNLAPAPNPGGFVPPADDPFGPAPIDPIPPVDVPAPPVAAPTGINKILVEKYGYEWVDGAAYKPGTAPQPVSPAPVDPTTEPGLDGIDDPFAPVPPVDGAFDPAPIDPFPPTGSVDDPFGPAPIGPFPPVDVPEPPVFDSRFDDVNDAIEYAEANGQGDLAVSEDGTITNSNGETMVYDSDGNLAPAPNPGGFVPPADDPFGPAPIDPIPPVDVPAPPVAAPTGINKILVEKYGYEWVDGAAYKPGTAPQPVSPAPVDPTTEPGLDGIDDPFAPVPPVDGAFDPAPIDPFPPTGSVDDPFGPAPIGPFPPVDVPEPPVFDSRFDDVNDAIEYAEANGQGDLAVSEDGTITNSNGETMVYDSDGNLAPAPNPGGFVPPADDPFGPAPIDPIPPVDVPAPPVAAPTGINKILVEKYGYEWVDGAAYKPGTAPQPVAPAPVDSITEPGLDGIDDPFAPVPPVDGAFDPAPIDPFPPTGSIDDPFGPAPIGPIPPVDVPEPPVFDSRFDDVNDAIEYAEANGQGDLAVSEDGTITNSNGETMVYDSDGNLAPAPNPGGFVPPADDPFGPAPIDPFPPVDVPAPPVFDSRFDDVNDAIEYAEANGQGDLAVSEDGTITNSNGETMVYDSDGNLAPAPNPGGFVPPIDGPFDPAPIDPFPPTGSVDDPFVPAPIGPFPPVDVPEPPVFDSRFDDVNDAIEYAEANGQGDLAVSEDGTIMNGNGETMVYDSDGNLAPAPNPGGFVPPIDGPFDPAPIDPFAPPLDPNAPWPAPVDSYPSEDFAPPPMDFVPPVDGASDPAPIGPFPPVDVPEPPVFDSRFDDVNDAIGYAEANGQGDLAVSEDGTIMNGNGETMVYDSDGNLAPAPNPGGFVPPIDGPFDPAPIDPFAPPLDPNAPWPAPVDSYPPEDFVPPPMDFVPPPMDFVPPPMDFVPPPEDFVPPPMDFVPPPMDFVPPPMDFVPPPMDFVPPPMDFVPPPMDFVPPPEDFVPPPMDFVPPPEDFVPPPMDFVPPPEDFVPPPMDIIF